MNVGFLAINPEGWIGLNSIFPNNVLKLTYVY